MDSQTEAEYHKSIESYLMSLPPEMKADETLYAKRLKLCGECRMLQKGFCVICGCFVTVRAIKAKLNCPAPDPRW